MRKTLVVLAVMALLVGIAVSFMPVPSQAVIALSPDYRIKTAVWVGTTNNGGTSTNSITLTSANRIIGVRVVGSTTPSAGLYDVSSTIPGACVNAYLIDEPAAASNSESITWYPAPKNITNGYLGVLNSASTTVTTVFYE